MHGGGVDEDLERKRAGREGEETIKQVFRVHTILMRITQQFKQLLRAIAPPGREASRLAGGRGRWPNHKGNESQ